MVRNQPHKEQLAKRNILRTQMGPRQQDDYTTGPGFPEPGPVNFIRTSPKKFPIKNPENGMTAGKQKDKEVAKWSKIAWGFFYATTQPLSTTGTAGTFEFFSARPHCIPFIEGSGSCLPRARYARCRGRDASQ